ncbi:MAG: SIMPL domain-containing protein [Flavobacteriia bacterium]|nr:MAG: SIMPL domain-containing protein [Flavobacteriia bacterium]
MKNIGLYILLGFLSLQTLAQNKNFIDQPFLETFAASDTLVMPDRIHLRIMLDEKDNKNRQSTEELEASMLRVLKGLNIDLDKNLSLLDFASNLKKYFLSSKKVLKTKMYALIVHDANTVGKVMIGLERVGISNVSISETEYSKSDELLLDLKAKAIAKARRNAEKMLEPLNQNLGKAIYISDLESGSMYSLSNRLQGEVAGVRIRGVSSIYGSSKQEELMIDFEKMKFSTGVKVKFIIE